jgi:uncharacterized membrane protein
MATSTPGGAKTNLGLEPNIAGLLCNIPGCCGIGVVFSIVAVIVEKQSRFVRFHALQSLLLNGAGLIVLVGLQVAGFVLGSIGLWAVGGLIWVLELAVLVALLAASVLLMIKANGGEEFELPVVGPMARQWA